MAGATIATGVGVIFLTGVTSGLAASDFNFPEQHQSEIVVA